MGRIQGQEKHDATADGTSGRAALAHAEPHLSLISHPVDGSAPPHDSGKCGYALFTSTQGTSSGWILDSRATDHITNDPTDLLITTHPRRAQIANANGVTYPVTGAGTVYLSDSLSLSNTLLVPSLSSKLLSVGQATEDLNCCALSYQDGQS